MTHQSLLYRFTDELLQSPTSARDRFSSPSPGSAKRRLFEFSPTEANEASSGKFQKINFSFENPSTFCKQES